MVAGAVVTADEGGPGSSGGPAGEARVVPQRREWWQVLAERRARWAAAHPRLMAFWARARTVVLFGSLLLVVGVWVFWPDLRLGMRAYAGCLWVVIAWFLLGRTKSLTWSGFMRFFAACVPWSVGIGALSTWLAHRVAVVEVLGGVSEAGARMAIAGIVEEVGKLVPILLVALLAPRRASRFGAVDWLLLGVASGTAFLAVEEAARRVAYATGNLSVLDDVLAPLYDGGLPPGWVTFGWWPIPTPLGASDTPVLGGGVGEFGGHAIMTALVTGLAGWAVMAWGARRRLLGLLLAAGPIAMLWSVISDHAMHNTGMTLFSILKTDPADPTGTAGAVAWVDPALTTVPAWIHVPWSLLGNGHGRPVVFLVLVVACLLIDARRIASMPAANFTGTPTPGWIVRTPVIGTVGALVWVTVRDLAQAVAGFAHSRDAGATRDAGSRRAAVARGGAVLSGQRTLRELANEHATGQIHPWARRAVTGLVLGLAAAMIFGLAPATADEIGSSANKQLADLTAPLRDTQTSSGGLPVSPPSDAPAAELPDSSTGLPSDLPTSLPTGPPTTFPSVDPLDLPTALPSDVPGVDGIPTGAPWLAGVFDALAEWWNEQPLIAQLAIGALAAALVVMSGGSLGLAFGLSGVLTWGLDHSAGIASLIRNPRQATRDYIATATPGQVAADTIGTVLTFAPGNFAGAATGRAVRSVADDLITDPAAWWASQRQLIRETREVGHIRNPLVRHPRDPANLIKGHTYNVDGNFFHVDSLGRPSGIDATLTKGSIGGATDPKVTPLGAGKGRQAGHLLSALLGGPNDHAANFVAQWERSNNPWQRMIEREVSKVVKSGEDVAFKVTPKYDGDAVMPTSIHIRAEGSNGYRLDYDLPNKADLPLYSAEVKAGNLPKNEHGFRFGTRD